MLQDKVVVITGAAGGIGRSLVQGFIGRGSRVVATDVSEDTAQGLVYMACDVGFYELDVTNADDCVQVMAEIVKKYGQLDVVVNNAGINRDNLLMRMKPEEWSSVLSVNLTGAFNVTKAVTRQMMRQRQGAIINVSSIAGQMGNAGQANYSAAKAGLIGLTKACARELAGRNIRVNAVAPGFIEVGMTDSLPDDIKEKFLREIPLGRAGTAEEVAHAVCYLAEAPYVTGQVLAINGGLYM